MAAALTEKLSAGRIDVRSAGTDPAGRINPAVVEVMREGGIDLSTRRPSRLDVDDVREADAVVTMGCGDACPVFPGKRYEDWEIPDPAGKSVQDVRAIHDEIETRVRALLESLES
jgi:protein-tyrosine-phosphatase